MPPRANSWKPCVVSRPSSSRRSMATPRATTGAYLKWKPTRRYFALGYPPVNRASWKWNGGSTLRLHSSFDTLRYYTWTNRGPGQMMVWIPICSGSRFRARQQAVATSNFPRIAMHLGGGDRKDNGPGHDQAADHRRGNPAAGRVLSTGSHLPFWLGSTR